MHSITAASIILRPVSFPREIHGARGARVSRGAGGQQETLAVGVVRRQSGGRDSGGGGVQVTNGGIS